MPTEFSKCDECHYTNVMPITHEINSVYYADHQKANIIMEIKNVPFKIAARIVQFTHEYQKCGYCHRTLLCEYHYQRGMENVMGYTAKCDACCWFDI